MSNPSCRLGGTGGCCGNFPTDGFALKELKMMAIEGMLQPETQDLSVFDDLCLGKLLIGCH